MNAAVEVDGAPLATPVIILPPGTTRWTFVVRKVTPGQTFLTSFLVKDSCGEIQKFVGAGMGNALIATPVPPPPDGVPTVTPTQPLPTVTATRTPLPSTPAATATSTTVPATATATATRTPLPSTPTATATSTTVPATATATMTATATATSTTEPVTATPTATVTATPSGAGASWSDSGSLPGITLGSMVLTSTYNNVGMELPFTEATGTLSSVSMEFRTGSGSAREALDPWITRQPGGQPAVFGSALQLQTNTDYDVRVRLQDALGNVAYRVASVTTRQDAIPAASSLTTTRYLDSVNGNDAQAGTSTATAWRTLPYAWTNAPSGAVVQLAPGYYTSPTTTRTTAITLKAQYPAIQYNAGSRTWTETAANQQSIILPQAVSAPRGTTAGSGFTTDSRGAGLGNWQSVTLNGQQVWKWTGSPTTSGGSYGAATVTYASTLSDEPRRVAPWKTDALTLSTPTGFAELVNTNLTWRSGAYMSINSSDVYLKLPTNAPSQDPNDLWITVSPRNQNGLTLNAPDSRITGVVMRGFFHALSVGSTGGTVNAHRVVIDHNLFQINFSALWMTAWNTGTDQYPSDITFEYNQVEDASLWSKSENQTTEPTIPWAFIKAYLKTADGTNYTTNRVGEDSETSAVAGRGWGRRTVIRFNKVSGPFNGISAGSNDGYDRYSSQDTDVHDNDLEYLADDAFEPDYASVNWRIWNNTVRNSYVLLSVAPSNFGPIYVYRNSIWQLSHAGLNYQDGTTPGTAYGIKYSQKSVEGGINVATPRIYFVHNTIWSNQAASEGGYKGDAGGTTANAMSRLYLRNNIVRVTRYAFHVRSASGWDEDYNHFATTDTGRGLLYPEIQADGSSQVAQPIWKSNVALYRADYLSRTGRSNAHTNTLGDFVTASVVDNLLTNAPNGQLTLRSGTNGFVDAGVVVPNISDQPGVTYNGSAPDLGAYER